VEVKL